MDYRIIFFRFVVEFWGRNMCFKVFVIAGMFFSYLIIFYRCCIRVRRLFGVTFDLSIVLGTFFFIYIEELEMFG